MTKAVATRTATKAVKSKSQLTTKQVQVQLALEKNPKLKDGDSVILWATSGTIWEEALIFRGKRCFDTLCTWHRKDEHTYLEPVGLNGALKWLQDTHMLDCRGLVQIKTWSPVANACFFDLVRYRNLENMQ